MASHQSSRRRFLRSSLTPLLGSLAVAAATSAPASAAPVPIPATPASLPASPCLHSWNYHYDAQDRLIRITDLGKTVTSHTFPDSPSQTLFPHG